MSDLYSAAHFRRQLDRLRVAIDRLVELDETVTWLVAGPEGARIHVSTESAKRLGLKPEHTDTTDRSHHHRTTWQGVGVCWLEAL